MQELMGRQHVVEAPPHGTVAASRDASGSEQVASSVARSGGKYNEDAGLMREYAIALECLFAEVFGVTIQRQV